MLEKVTRRVCDRCGAQTEHLSGAAPEDWGKICAVRAAVRLDITRTQDLCGDCWRSYRRWFEEPQPRLRVIGDVDDAAE